MEKENPCGWPLTWGIHSLKERELRWPKNTNRPPSPYERLWTQAEVTSLSRDPRSPAGVVRLSVTLESLLSGTVLSINRCSLYTSCTSRQQYRLVGCRAKVFFLNFISNWCKSFVFSTNLQVRVYRTILVRVSSSEIKKIQNGRQNPRWLPISSFFALGHNFCTIEPRMVILFNMFMFLYMGI